jgi:hypothetical protein
MSKWWHILATVGLAVASAVTPGIQGVLSSHTIIATVLAGAWAVLGNIVQSPIAGKLN